jgi:hypothetical protein
LNDEKVELNIKYESLKKEKLENQNELRYQIEI